MGRRVRQNHGLDPCGQNRDKTRSSERCRAVAAKLRAARHLSAYAADVAQRSVQVIHGFSLYTAKYPDAARLSRYRICRARGRAQVCGMREFPGVTALMLCIRA